MDTDDKYKLGGVAIDVEGNVRNVLGTPEQPQRATKATFIMGDNTFVVEPDDDKHIKVTLQVR